MIIVAFVNEAGEVQNIISPGSDSDYIDGQIYGGLTARYLPNTVDWSEAIQRYVYLDGEWVVRPPKPGRYYHYVDGAWAVNRDLLLTEIRGQRNRRLMLSDWTQLSDNHLTEAQKAEWSVYRDSLRDITDSLPQYIDDVDQVVWPTPPSPLGYL